MKFLSKIKSSIGSDMFDEVFAKRGDATLMFAIDTTGSMKEEISAAKAIAKTIISETREFKVDYILSPFNDPSKCENVLCSIYSYSTLTRSKS